MRVLHVHDHAAFKGGVEQIMHDLADGLASRGDEQGILFTEGGSTEKFMGPFAWSGMCPDEVMRSYKPDVAIFHKVKNPQVVRAIASTIPSVQMVHDHDLVCPRRHKYFPLTGKICNKPAGVSCLSHMCFIERPSKYQKIPVTLFEGVKRQQQDFGAIDEVRQFVVGSQWMADELRVNGLPEALINIVPPIPAAIDQVKPVPMTQSREILYVGQVIRGKGVDLLLQAVALLKNQYTLTIVGTGRQQDEFEALASSLGIADKVCFTGWVDHDQLDSYYRRSQIVVVPSRWPEPFGMVGVEGMARGRPVVAFAAGGIQDWLVHNTTGLLARPGRVDDFATQLDRLLGDFSLTEKLGEQAVRHVQQQYSHSKFVSAMQAILTGVMR